MNTSSREGQRLCHILKLKRNQNWVWALKILIETPYEVFPLYNHSISVLNRRETLKFKNDWPYQRTATNGYFGYRSICQLYSWLIDFKYWKITIVRTSIPKHKDIFCLLSNKMKKSNKSSQLRSWKNECLALMLENKAFISCRLLFHPSTNPPQATVNTGLQLTNGHLHYDQFVPLFPC